MKNEYNNKEKEMMSFSTAFTIIIIILVMAAVLVLLLFVYSNVTFEKNAEKQCKKIGMDLFSSSTGSIFIESSITCWDSKTKEMRKIK